MVNRNLFLLTRAAHIALALATLSAAAAPVTHGVAVGEVTTQSAIVWSRSDRDSTMHIALTGPGAGPERSVQVSYKSDFTGKVLLRDLKADTVYRYKVWFTETASETKENDKDPPAVETHESGEGSFRTAPEPASRRAARFSFGGDLAGQNVCRDAKEGFPIMTTLAQAPMDFFVGLGDMIYADALCESIGRYGNAQVEGGFQQASSTSGYWAHWRYSREDSGFQKLLARTPYFAVWDDHEIVNDAGPDSDTRNQAPYVAGMHLMPLAMRAFLDYNPVIPARRIPLPLYRNVRWGKHLELFLLDTRQSRDPNRDRDSVDKPKSMLGKHQLSWLKDSLAASDATWKIIVTSVPLSIPTGHPPENGRDGWASGDGNTGFEQELLGLLRHLRDKHVRNIVFIATDVHFASAQRLRPFADSPKFIVHEFVAGPLNAGLFPRDELDPTLNPERLLYFGPERQVETWREARQWMNYGFVDIDRRGTLRFAIHDVNGKPVRQLSLKPDR
jgi:alkaline phosphatase D